MAKLKYLFKVLYFVERYIAHIIVRLIWNFCVNVYQVFDFLLRRVSVLILKIVWNGLVNIVNMSKIIKNITVNMVYGLKQNFIVFFDFFAKQSVIQNYLPAAAVVVPLFAVWVGIDTYFGRNNKLDALADELENRFILNELNGKTFETISFYINDPAALPQLPQDIVSLDKQFIDKIGNMSFFEKTTAIAQSDISGKIEDNTSPDVTSPDVIKAQPLVYEKKQVFAPDLLDNQIEQAEVDNDSGPVKDNQARDELKSMKKEVIKKDADKAELKCGDIKSGKAEVYGTGNNPAQKLKETKKYADSIEKRKKDAYMLFLKGRTEAQRGNCETAAEMLEKAKQGDPHEAELLYYLGICYCRMGEYAKGVKELEASYDLIIDPNILVPIKNAYFMLGLKQTKNKDYQSALKSFKRVVEIDPDDGRAFFNIGMCEIVFENYEQALSDFNNAEKKGFTCIELNLNRAAAYKKTGKTKEAIEEYKNILSEQPLYAPAHYNMAVLLEDKVIKTGEYDKYASDAIYHYKRALELDKSFYESSFNISRVYYAMGDISMSIKWLKRCIELNGNFPEAHLFLSKLYIEKGAYNNALAQVELMEKLGYNFKELNHMREEIFQICGIKEIDNE
ncbi:tetratricopeptide repeat protein [bacterium]|nr:tetratricopeptide repeat protein [bacterium]